MRGRLVLVDLSKDRRASRWNPGGGARGGHGCSLGAILRHMKVEEIAEAIAKLPPDQLARFRRWFTAFEVGRTDHAQGLDSTATKLGRLAGRAYAELKKRAKEP
jgi:hypothetical protein